MEYQHKSVLLEESLDHLNLKKGGIYLDATLGDGGHTKAMLERGVKVISIDQDPEAIERSKNRLKEYKIGINPALPITGLNDLDCLLVKTNFSRLEEIFNLKFDGILFDLGISTLQILKPERGFTFQEEGPLDMRMDPDLGVTAADLLNALGPKELTRLFEELSDETYAKKIAIKIVEARKVTPIKTTRQLAELISRIKPNLGKIHPATKVFQALRMAVNLERDSLSTALPQALELLKPGGRLVIISFHSGEDALIKHFLKKQEDNGQLKVLTKKPIKPTETEIFNNQRSRSAKLRSAQKNV